MVVVTRNSPKTSSSLSRMRAAAASSRLVIAGGVEQKLALFGQDQPARVAVKQRGVEVFLQRADLAADGGLAQMQRVARMGQAAGIRHRVKYPQLVPIHASLPLPPGVFARPRGLHRDIVLRWSTLTGRSA
jgi:hypothetical protein